MTVRERESRPVAGAAIAKADGPSTIMPQGADNVVVPAPFQPMPELTAEQYAALRADIEVHGIRVPVVVDQHGRILDGHNRQAIAAELGLTVPTEVVTIADDDEAHDVAVTLNCARRHLTREQVRVLIRAEHLRRPGDSDRALARRIGCSPSTVAAVLRPDERVSNLDTWQPPGDVDLKLKGAVLKVYDSTNYAAELSTSDEADRWCRAAMIQDADDTFALKTLLASDVDPIVIACAIVGRMSLWKARGMDRARIRSLFEPWIDLALSPSTREAYRQDLFFGPAAKAADEGLVEALLANLGSVPLIPAGIAGVAR